MGWLRKKIRHASWLALLALALQFGLSFAHSHPASFASGQQIQVTSGNDTDVIGDLCDICAVVSMAYSSIDAAPPSLTTPMHASEARAVVIAFSAPRDDSRAAFRSRAPPRS